MPPAAFERLSAQDSSFIFFEGPGTHMHVSAVVIFETGPLATPDGSLDIARLREYVASRLHLTPRYRQRLAFTPIQRHPVWVDDDRFNLEYHVRHTSLPAPGGDAQLKALAGRIMSQQLDRTKPLWEMWFVEGLEGGRFALIAKVHHCMVDGMSGMGLMNAIFSAAPETELEAPQAWQARPVPTRAELLRHELLHRARAPMSLARAARDALMRPEEASSQIAENAKAVWHALYLGVRVPPETPINRPIGTHRRIDWHAVDLADVKDVKKRLDGTVNDVVLTVVTGAMRRFLRARRVPLRGLDFRVVVPVDMRRGPEDDAAANRVSAFFVTLPVGKKNPIRQFEEIGEETRKLRESDAARGIDILTRLTDWTGSDLLTSVGTRLAQTFRPHNMIVTNVPGPPYPLYLLGAKMVSMCPQLPLFENQGLGIAVTSYLGRVCFGLIGDWDLVPDIDRLRRNVAESFDDLRRRAEEVG